MISLVNYPSRTIGGHVVHYVGRVCDHAVDHVVPREENGFIPHTLKHHVLFGYSLILILVKALAVVIPIALPAAVLYSSAITSENIFALTNAARTTAGLSALTVNGLLTNAAQAKAADMLEGQYFAHQSPDGRMPWNFIRDTGYSYRYAGENLAVHFTEAEAVQGGWMASPTHRANILDERYTEIGVGVSSGQFEGVPTVFVVQMFGTPKMAAAAPELTTVPTPEPVAEVIPEPKTEPVNETPVIVAEPVAEAEPVIESEPIAEIPVVMNGATILPETASIVPIPMGYRVSVSINNARSASVALADATLPLSPDPAGTGVWYGSMTDTNALTQGGVLTVIAVGEDDAVSSAVLATLTPAEIPQELYLFNGDQRIAPKVFGIVDVGNFNDQAKRFYAYVSVALGALLLVALAYRFHRHHPTVVAHATGVLALTIFLGML